MPTIDTNNDLLSIGKLCELLGTTPARIEKCCQQQNIKPSLRLNGVAYYTDSVVNKLRKYLKIKEPV